MQLHQISNVSHNFNFFRSKRKIEIMPKKVQAKIKKNKKDKVLYPPKNYSPL